MRNEKGFAAIIMVSIVTFMVLTFIGSATVYYGALYKDIAKQERTVIAHLATEDFARKFSQAHEDFRSGCNTTTHIPDTIRQTCWARSTSLNPNPNCVPFPSGATNSENPRLICLNLDQANPGGGGAGGSDGGQAPGTNANTIRIVGTIVEPKRDLIDQIKEQYYAFTFRANIAMDVIAAKIQNAAVAQAAAASYLPVIAGAPTSRFTAGINCTGAGADPIYCKRCPGGAAAANLSQCLRIQLCIRPGGCTQEGHWVRRNLAILLR